MNGLIFGNPQAYGRIPDPPEPPMCPETFEEDICRCCSEYDVCREEYERMVGNDD